MWDVLAEVWLWIVVGAIILVVVGIALAVLWTMLATVVRDVRSGLRDPKQQVGTGCGLAVVLFIILGLFLLYMAGRTAN